MMLKKANLIILIGIFLTLFSACGKKYEAYQENDLDGTKDSLLAAFCENETISGHDQNDVSNTISYEMIMTNDYVTIDEIYEQLSKQTSLSEDEQGLFEQILLLKNCSGRFVQQSEESTNRYTADISFYFSKGELCCTINYSGYMGEIADGIVMETEQKGFSFETFPKGNLYGKEQDFCIYIGNEQIYISWANVCEYTLTRGNGSVEAVQEHREVLGDSTILDEIISMVDTNYVDYYHSAFYNRESAEFFVFFQVMDNYQYYLTTEKDKFEKYWDSIRGNAELLSETIAEAVQVGGFNDDVYVCWVSQINEKNSYSIDELLLTACNGEIVSDFYTAGECKENLQGTRNDESRSTIHKPSSGEQSALECAMDYLSFTSFSYQSLIEQLKYEGFSNSEAIYAADNCGADWNQQAIKKAREYLDFLDLSQGELVDQLEFEGFTSEQAVFGASRAG